MSILVCREILKLMKSNLLELNWKIISVVAVVIILLVLAVIYLNTTNKSSSSPGITAPTSSPTLKIATKSESRTYKQHDYSLSYPSDLHLIPEETEKGVRTVSLKKNEDPNFEIILDIFSNSFIDPEKIYSLLEKDGYKMKPTLIADIPARTYTGSIIIKKQQIQQIVTVFTYRENIYQITLNYVSSTQENMYEDQYGKILTAFQLIDQ